MSTGGSGGADDGRRAVVTGGARGIGRAISLALARDGADVAVVDLDGSGADETATLVAKTGRRARAYRVDVSDEDAVLKLYADLAGEFGIVDILVNNAGICPTTPVLDIRSAEWDRVLGVNLRSVFLMSREAFRIMRERKAGKIVNIASIAAKTGGLVAGSHYSASKAGIVAFSKSLALAAAPFHVNVNVVCPGPTATPMTDAWGAETNAAFVAKIPWQEYGRPEDIADAVAFLASERARFITGEVLDVNGGLLMD
jgi:3-oxoacyl-[acyl-carrier protein] reductase